MAVNPGQGAFDVDDGDGPLVRVRLKLVHERAKALGLKVTKHSPTLYWILPTDHPLVPVDYDLPMTLETVEQELTVLQRMHHDGCQG